MSCGAPAPARPGPDRDAERRADDPVEQTGRSTPVRHPRARRSSAMGPADQQNTPAARNTSATRDGQARGCGNSTSATTSRGWRRRRRLRSRQVFAHDERARRRAVGLAVVALAASDLAKAEARVERDRGGVVRARLRETARAPATRRRAPDASRSRSRADAATAQRRIDRDGQDLRLVGGDPRQREAAQFAARRIERGAASVVGLASNVSNSAADQGWANAGGVEGGALLAPCRSQRAQWPGGVGGGTATHERRPGHGSARGDASRRRRLGVRRLDVERARRTIARIGGERRSAPPRDVGDRSAAPSDSKSSPARARLPREQAGGVAGHARRPRADRPHRFAQRARARGGNQRPSGCLEQLKIDARHAARRLPRR